ncbi:MAG: threonine synthase [Alphaproteobacteria bacterium]|nr:threonine synthase [Alphaproteobacteria bacterium]
MYFTGFHCVGCDATYPADRDLLLCERCENLLEADYDYDRIRADLPREGFAQRPHGVWRWVELLPVLDRAKIVTLGEGDTPLLRCDRIAAAVGVDELWVKSDATGNPTGSLKDRSITVSATKAAEFGYRVLACDSTGNKASSVAAYAARAGLGSVVFCPHDTPVPKMAQAIFFGARLIRVRGHYSQINAMYRRLIHSKSVAWYDCGTDNPFRYEGKKTYAYEMAQAFGWDVPDCVVHPASGGMSIAKTWKGFGELRRLGWTERSPRMFGVQAANCGPIARSWAAGADIVAPVEKKPTLASALAAADPGLLGTRALAAIRASGGAAAGISEDEILDSVRLLASEGLFIEPSGAVTIAGVRRMVAAGQITRGERVVCVVTGSGFKDFERLQEMVTIPEKVVEGYDEMLAEAQSV